MRENLVSLTKEEIYHLIYLIRDNRIKGFYFLCSKRKHGKIADKITAKLQEAYDAMS